MINALSKGMQAVKLCTNKITQFLTFSIFTNLIYFC